MCDLATSSHTFCATRPSSSCTFCATGPMSSHTFYVTWSLPGLKKIQN